MGLIYHLLHYVYVKLLIEEGHWTRRCYLREIFHWSFCFPELHSTTKSNMNPGFYTWQYFKVVSDSWHYCRWIKTLDFNMETALISCHLLQLILFFFKAWSRSFLKPYPGVHYCNHDDEVPLTLQSNHLNLNQVFSVPKPDQTLTIALSYRRHWQMMSSYWYRHQSRKLFHVSGSYKWSVFLFNLKDWLARRRSKKNINTKEEDGKEKE